MAGKTPGEIQVLLQLPEVPCFIRKVDVPAGTGPRESKVGLQYKFNDPQGSLAAPSQFQLTGGRFLPPKSFNDPIPLAPATALPRVSRGK
jgi:hypothetical protein